MLRKRISIRIEHTEVTLSVTEVFTQESHPIGTTSGHAPPPRHCPVCGSPWLPDLRDILGTLRLPAAQLKLAASEGKLHLFCSPENEVWVCERSISLSVTVGILAALALWVPALDLLARFLQNSGSHKPKH